MPSASAPLDPAAGSVPVPQGSTSPGSHDTPSIPHAVNSAAVGGAESTQQTSPGLGTNNNAQAEGGPDWMNQSDIVDQASKGSTNGKTSDANVDELRSKQHPSVGDAGEQSGPTGLSIGDRKSTKIEETEHDKQQQDLLDGKPSRDGEGSAGLSFDAGN